MSIDGAAIFYNARIIKSPRNEGGVGLGRGQILQWIFVAHSGLLRKFMYVKTLALNWQSWLIIIPLSNIWNQK